MPINKVLPLCPTICCCPEIVLEGDKFIITDDYKGKISIPIKDMNSLIKKLDEIISLPGNSVDNKG